MPRAKVITKANRPMPGKVAGTFSRAEADAREDAIWSARRDPETGFGIAVFDLDPETHEPRIDATGIDAFRVFPPR